MPKLSEKETLIIFNKYKKTMIKLMGSKSTTSRQLNIIGNQLFGNRYIGTFSQDNIPFHKVKPDTFAIINTDTQGKPGVHWVALYFTAKTAYVWDSYGRDSNKLLPVFIKQLKLRNIRFKNSDPDEDQSRTSEICGQLCLAFMLTVDKIGVMNAMKV